MFLEHGEDLLLDCRRLGKVSTDMLQIFFGCPHRCSTARELEDRTARLLLANEKVHLCSFATTIRDLRKSIVEINGAFLTSKIPLIANILNIYSTEQDKYSMVSCSLVAKGLLFTSYCLSNAIDSME